MGCKQQQRTQIPKTGWATDGFGCLLVGKLSSQQNKFVNKMKRQSLCKIMGTRGWFDGRPDSADSVVE